MSLTTIQKRSMVVFIVVLCICARAFSSPLKVGITLSGPPIVERVNTAKGPYYFGFCIDIMNDICKRIGEKCIYEDITLNDQLKLLDNGDIDLLVQAKPYTSANLQHYAISLPYAVSKIQFVTLKSGSINKIEDIKNKKIGVIKSTFYNLLLQSSYSTHNEIIAYQATADLLSALAQNKIDVIVLNNAIAHELSNNNFYNIKLVGPDQALGEGYGIVALADKAKLIEAINKAILNIQKDGTYASIYQKYYKP